MPQAIGFDLDGTLFDDRQYARAGLKNAGARLESRVGVDLTDALLAAYFERDIREGTFDTVLREHDLSTEYVPAFVDAFHGNEAELDPYPGTRSTLAHLGDTAELGLLTGGTNGRAKLDRLGLTAYFDAVVTTADGEATKREPAPFETLAADLGVTASEMAYVGDRPALDCQVPNALGMTTIRVRTGQWTIEDQPARARADAVVDSIADVPGALERFE